MTLRLDLVDSTKLNPVDGFWVSFELFVRDLLKKLSLLKFIFHIRRDNKSLDAVVLVLGPGGELVVADSKRAIGGINLLDLGVSLSEKLQSQVVLLLDTIAQAESSHVLRKSLLCLSGDSLILIATNLL